MGEPMSNDERMTLTTLASHLHKFRTEVRDLENQHATMAHSIREMELQIQMSHVRLKDLRLRMQQKRNMIERLERMQKVRLDELKVEQRWRERVLYVERCRAYLRPHEHPHDMRMKDVVALAHKQHLLSLVDDWRTRRWTTTDEDDMRNTTNGIVLKNNHHDDHDILIHERMNGILIHGIEDDDDGIMVFQDDHRKTQHTIPVLVWYSLLEQDNAHGFSIDSDVSSLDHVIVMRPMHDDVDSCRQRVYKEEGRVPSSVED